MKLKETSDWGLKEKLLFTLLMLLLFRMGTAIPVPYVNGTLFKQMVEQTAAGDVFTLMSMVGGTLMTMSFLSLSVIPELKLTDQGYVDLGRGGHVSLFAD